MLPDDRDQPMVFLGGKDYVGLFQDLTAGSADKRIIVYNSANAPGGAPGCRTVRFNTTTRTKLALRVREGADCWHRGSAAVTRTSRPAPLETAGRSLCS